MNLLSRYKDYLSTVLGLAPRTCSEHVRTAKHWLSNGPMEGPESLISWCFSTRQHQAGMRELSFITAFCAWREETEGIKNPFSSIKKHRIPRDSGVKKIPDPPTPDQVQNVIAHEPDPQWRLVIACAYVLGMRRNEIVRLNILDVRIDHVRVLGKGNKERRIPVPHGIRETLIKLQMYRLDFTGQADGPLFTRLSGSRIDGWTINYLVKTAGERVGLKLHPHLLRHAYASHLIQAGCPIEKVAILMGHTDIRTTWRYAHLRVNVQDVQIMGGVTC